MSTVLNPAEKRMYPLTPPDDDRRFTLGLVFTVGKVLENAGYPPITSGGDLVALQRSLFGFLYAVPEAQCPPECRQNWQRASDPLTHVDHCPNARADGAR